jgi:hypothetical protein
LEHRLEPDFAGMRDWALRDPDHLELNELLDKGFKRPLSFLVVNLKLLAGSIDQVRKGHDFLLFDQLPNGSTRAIEAVVPQSFQM